MVSPKVTTVGDRSKIAHWLAAFSVTIGKSSLDLNKRDLRTNYSQGGYRLDSLKQQNRSYVAP